MDNFASAVSLLTKSLKIHVM